MLDWPLIVARSFEALGQWLFTFLPALLGSLLVFLIGWFVAVALSKVIKEVLSKLNFNKFIERTGWSDALAKANFKVTPDELFASLIKWVLIVVFLMASVEILGLDQFAGFLKGILTYIPRVVVASLILILGAVLADILEKVVVAAIEKAKIGHAPFVGTIAKWSIWGFTIFAVLEQLRVATFLIQTMFTGFVAFFVIAFGLAFGLGGKDVAGEMLQNLKRKLQSR